MTRTKPGRIAIASAAAALALGAAAWSARPDAPASAVASARPSVLDTLTLLRWGQGALDWTLPDAKGDAHARTPDHRA